MQETGWKGSRARDLGEGSKLNYSRTESHRNGVSIVFHKKHIDGVLEVKRINDRVMLMRLDLGAMPHHRFL